MTAKELQQRNEKADQLRVLQTDDGQYFVESGEGKILYNVTISDSGDRCCCGDYSKNIKRDPDFRCKHILAKGKTMVTLSRKISRKRTSNNYHRFLLAQPRSCLMLFSLLSKL